MDRWSILYGKLLRVVVVISRVRARCCLRRWWVGGVVMKWTRCVYVSVALNGNILYPPLIHTVTVWQSGSTRLWHQMHAGMCYCYMLHWPVFFGLQCAPIIVYNKISIRILDNLMVGKIEVISVCHGEDLHFIL